MRLKILVGALILAVAVPALGNAADKHAKKPHRIVIQVDQNDPAVMNLALNNASNVLQYYRDKHEEVQVEVVAYGPGLHMLRDDTSPVKARIEQIKQLSFPSRIDFAACNNTKQGMEKAEGHSITIIPQASIVPSGVIEVTQRQEQGWSYVRP